MRTPSGIFTQQAAISATEYTLWGNTALGSVTDDVTAYENGLIIGTKFRTNQAGNIVGIRWQKAASSSAQDVALFQGTTNVSGTRTVSGEGTSGWQRMDFASPVSISANTIYIAVVRLTCGQPYTYIASANYFASSGYTNGPIEAVANSVSVNGVYKYANTMQVPSDTWEAACYFADIVFAA